MSRSGGLSDRMNQRAVSAPYLSMMAPGSTVLRFDFDIASTRPMVTGAFAAFTIALRLPSGARLNSTSSG